MPRVLLTAFDPYGQWTTNASWLALVELTRDLPSRPTLTTRRYPVDFRGLEERLARDLTQPYDFVIHLGQAPGRATVELELLAVNRREDPNATEIGERTAGELVSGGPPAYATQIPVHSLQQQIVAAGIPCRVSYHAGTYLCNAAYYWSLHTIATRQLPTDALFMHLPLDPSQVAARGGQEPSLPVSLSAEAIRCVLQSLPDPDRSLELV